MVSEVVCEAEFEGASLQQICAGEVFTDYVLEYRFADHRTYTMRFRCYALEPYVEVHERFGLRMGAELRWTWNPTGAFDRLVSHRGPDFEGEPQPVLDELGKDRPRDILCRLQMPGIGEYFVPNNRYYWALYHGADEAAGMLGILGLYGDRWQQPVANMPVVHEAGGSAQWTSSLASGARYWLLYAGPVETTYTADRRFVFHRLQAQFNQLRLDAHLDLDNETLWDAESWQSPGFWSADDRQAAAQRRLADYPEVQKVLDNPGRWSTHFLATRALLNPTPEAWRQLHDSLADRFALWVRQFQGWRDGRNDYDKNVIGFTRRLRGLLIGYELLRKEGVLSPAEIGRFNAWFVFAARRITDESRWPHERTWKHPKHPESARGIYAYNGEHAPDKLVWTNSLPNFQSDPMAALAQLSALFPEHPDAPAWRQKALADIDRQLDAYCGESGAWEESINYALYTLSYFVITFRTLKQRLGIDYFQDARMRRYVGWLTRFYGPRDRRCDAYSFPPIGNSNLPSGGGEYLLAYGAELPPDDPLRAACFAIYQSQAHRAAPHEHYANVYMAMAPIIDRHYPLPGPFESELMDEIGVMMRHRHLAPDESYLFQKIGWAKDHYEGDETAFHWHAKGTPIAADYGTYTGDAATWAAHNTVEIPDADPLQRGFLAASHLTQGFDYTHCEVPVILKLLWGRVRSFAEVDGRDGIVNRQETPYYYIGDTNPVGPPTWRVRKLLWIKPDYVVTYDRVHGDVPHRLNLHVVADDLARDGAMLDFDGRYDLDLRAFVQHPAEFEMETGELAPGRIPEEAQAVHRQRYVRLYNHQDGIYRALLFAAEKGREVTIEAAGEHGIRVVTPEYTDLVFVHDEPLDLTLAEGVSLCGSVGWARRYADGRLEAALLDGDRIAAFGQTWTGRAPWSWSDSAGFTTLSGPPRRLQHQAD